MTIAADRGGPFGRGAATAGAGAPRNWMRAAAPGIAPRRRPAESSPVGSRDAQRPQVALARGRASTWLMATGLGVALYLLRAAVSLHRR